MNRPFYHVKKRALLAIAGCVWLAAGFNVARLGVLSYISLDEISAVHILLSAVVFGIFGFTLLSTGNKTCLEFFRSEILSHYGIHDERRYMAKKFRTGA